MVPKEFKNRVKGRSRQGITQVYCSHLGNYLKGTIDPKSREKMLWLEETYPFVKGENGSNIKEEAQNPISKPYQVVLAEKYLQLYRSSVKRGKEFNLDIKDVHLLMKEEACYYTKTRFEGSGDYKMTVDRVDNSKGYVKGNVVACTHVANKMKNEIFERPTRDAGVNIQFISEVASAVLNHIGG